MSKNHETPISPKCPNCGAALKYDFNQKKLVCANCDSTVSFGDDTDEAITGFDFSSIVKNAENPLDFQLPIYICKSCGAEIIADPETVSLICPYCQNDIIKSDQLTGPLRPDCILPFKIKPEELTNTIKEFYKDKKFLPRDFFEKSKMDRINGVFVPFWIFDGKLTGDITYSSVYKHRTRSGAYDVDSTDHYRNVRSISMEFAGLPVDALGKTDDDMMDSLEPFDLSEALPFKMEYLAGYTADRFDQKADGLVERAERRMRNTAAGVGKSKMSENYSDISYKGSSLKIEMKKVRYVLMPIYLFTIEYHLKKYPFAINGQTGKAVGEVPIGEKGVLAFRLILMFGIAGIAILLMFLKYLLVH